MKPQTLDGVIYDVEFIGSNTWRVRMAHRDHMLNKRILGQFLVEETIIAQRMENNINWPCCATVDQFGYLDTFFWYE